MTDEREMRERAREHFKFATMCLNGRGHHCSGCARINEDSIAQTAVEFASAERDAERERSAEMLEEIAEEHHVAHQDKFKSEWQRETEWNKYIRYKEAAELVRSRMAAKGEK